VSALTERLMSLVALLGVCGIVVSSVSLQHHYATSKTTYCDIGETFNCDIVNRSEYSLILGVPVALIGMLGYAALVGLATVYRERRETPAILFGGAVAGLAFALYLTYIEARVLSVWCILCLSSLAVIAMTTILAAVIWRKRSSQ
jgi:vitamin-K-epoxide reductase (warfarin-sensitive)